MYANHARLCPEFLSGKVKKETDFFFPLHLYKQGSNENNRWWRVLGSLYCMWLGWCSNTMCVCVCAGVLVRDRRCVHVGFMWVHIYACAYKYLHLTIKLCTCFFFFFFTAIFLCPVFVWSAFDFLLNCPHLNKYLHWDKTQTLFQAFWKMFQARSQLL